MVEVVRNFHDCTPPSVCNGMRWQFCGLLLTVSVCSLSLFAQSGRLDAVPTKTTIDVVVTDTDGQPIEGAQVAWTYGGPLEGGFPMYQRRTPAKAERGTGFDGRYTIDIPGPGYWRFGVQRDGYLDPDEITRVEHIESVRVDFYKSVRLTVTLMRAASFEGSVHLQDGRRVADAIVRLQPASLGLEPGRRSGASWLLRRTDREGNYRFPVVPPGEYGMWIAPPEAIGRESLIQNDRGEWTGYAGTFWHAGVEELRRIIPATVMAGDDIRGYNVILRKVRVYPVKGVLYDERTNKPFTNALVGLRVGGEAPIQLLPPRAVDPRTGAFELPPLAEGEYELLIYRNDPGTTLPVTAPFALGAAPQPKNSRAQAPADESQAATWSSIGHKAESGLAVFVPEWRPWQAKLTFHDYDTPKPGRPVDWYPQQRTHVRLAPTTLPEFEPVEAAFDSDSPRIRDSRTRDLDLRTPLLPPSVYQIEIEAPSGWYVDAVRTGPLSLWDSPNGLSISSATRQGAEIVLERGGAALDGAVVTRKLEPVQNASVCVVAEHPVRRQQPGGGFCVRTAPDGSFHTRWLSPGLWKVWAFPKRPEVRPDNARFEETYKQGWLEVEVPKEGGVADRRLTLDQ